MAPGDLLAALRDFANFACPESRFVVLERLGYVRRDPRIANTGELTDAGRAALATATVVRL